MVHEIFFGPRTLGHGCFDCKNLGILQIIWINFLAAATASTSAAAWNWANSIEQCIFSRIQHATKSSNCPNKRCFVLRSQSIRTYTIFTIFHAINAVSATITVFYSLTLNIVTKQRNNFSLKIIDDKFLWAP